ncbi:MAG: hypothetical protein ACQER9_03440 [Nanobdellota archaeon]
MKNLTITLLIITILSLGVHAYTDNYIITEDICKYDYLNENQSELNMNFNPSGCKKEIDLEDEIKLTFNDTIIGENKKLCLIGIEGTEDIRPFTLKINDNLVLEKEEIDFLRTLEEGKKIYSLIREVEDKNKTLMLETEKGSELNLTEMICLPQIPETTSIIQYDENLYQDGNIKLTQEFNNPLLNYVNDLKSKIILKDGYNKINTDGLPDYCKNETSGSDIEIDCDIPEKTSEISFRIESSYNSEITIPINTYISHTGFDGEKIDFMESDKGQLNLKTIDDNNNNIILKSKEGYKNISQVEKYDELIGADIECSQNNNHASLVIRNKAAGISCTYTSNFKIGEKIYIDFENNECDYPFIINKPGNYEFLKSCSGSSNCLGECNKPLPSSFTDIRNFINNYFSIGNSLHSFHGGNSIGDCVCDSSSIFKEIKLFENKESIEVYDFE